jgi:hypothetical protein
LEGRTANRDGVGTRVVIDTPQGQTTHHRLGGGSYLSQSEGAIYVPHTPGDVTATIHWCAGQQSQISLQTLPTNRGLLLRQSLTTDMAP